MMGLPEKKSFANEKVPFPQMTMAAFSEDKKLFGKIWLYYSQKHNFRGNTFFSKVIKNGFMAVPHVI